MRHMVRRLYVDALPPDLFHQRRRSSTPRQQRKRHRDHRGDP